MKRRVVPNTLGILEFNEFMMEASLSDAGFEETPFTWSNNQVGRHRIWQRLDRFLINGDLLSASYSMKVQHLGRIASDHTPIIASFSIPPKMKSRFLFQRF